MFKHIIFDFDGVIINSHEVQLKALTESFAAICGDGIPPYDDFFSHSGDSLANIFRLLGLPIEMIPVYHQISRDNIGLIKIHKGMLELLEKLNETGYICSLCTGKDRNRTIEILKWLNMEHLFKVVVCSDDVVNPKPHPESLIFIIKKVGYPTDNTIMIGDGINDIISAEKANIKSIAVTWGDLPVNEIIKSGPTFVAHSVPELMFILDIK